MDLETKLRENYVLQSQPMHLQEHFLKANMRDELPFGVPSSQGFLQDFHHIDHQFHVNGSSSNPPFGVQTPSFDPSDTFNYGCSSADFDVYECKPFVENNGTGHAQVMDNFQYGNHGLNLPQRNNQVDMLGGNQTCVPFNSQEIIKPMNFVIPDEVSCITPANYYKKVGLNKNNRASSTIARRTYKVRNKSSIVKGQWTADEDRLLIQLVDQYGVRKWSHIAQMLPGRIGKQCRERWHNHLRPDIKKDSWTDEEDKILIQAHAEIGNKWAEIAKMLPGRTENSIKNHWNATKRRQYSKRKCRSKYPRGSLLQEYIKSLNLDQNPPIDYRKKSSAKTGTSKTAAATQPQIADDDRLVPNYDFNYVPDFCLDENLFQEGCSIDSLLDNMPCAPTMDHEKDFGGAKMPLVNVDEHHFERDMAQDVAPTLGGVQVKKELDLVEMMSQVNEVVNI
ncbi:hypothetical protein L6164_011058 [Bauhinia variegata]|uniref:Uncharacterized protein n=1 Tax=Bauhinia variegata TaxID=167791 RepID=A0ACB9P4U3_BAUVA|nr:hypothetical protein L6164_011058 [Bauhinia variegata]